MTLAVAYRTKHGITLAADRCITEGNRTYLTDSKLWSPTPGIMVAYAGSCRCFNLLKRKGMQMVSHLVDPDYISANMLEAAFKDEELGDDSASFIIVSADSIYLGDTDGTAFTSGDDFVSIGTGAEFANGFWSGHGGNPTGTFCKKLFKATSSAVTGVSPEFCEIVVRQPEQ